MPKKEIDIVIASIYLGTKERKNPSEDTYQFLKIDDFEIVHHINEIEKTGRIVIRPLQWHIKEIPVRYCSECLKEGKRVDSVAGSVSDSEKLAWCEEHFRIKERARNPCPNCDKGYMEFGIDDMHCPYCKYREPHVHNIKMRTDGIFSLKPSEVKESGKLPQYFMCTCTEWDTPEEHERRREKFKKGK